MNFFKPTIYGVSGLIFSLMLIFSGCEDKNPDPEYPGAQEPAGNSGYTPRILLNGDPLTFTHSPYYMGSNLMADASALLMALDYTIDWDSTSKVLTASSKTQNQAGAKNIKFTEGAEVAEINGAKIVLPVKAEVKNGKLMTPARFTADKAGVAILEWDKDSESLQGYYYEKCDYGIYFYGHQPDNTDATGAEKFISGQTNRFFDPAKPTIIYTHGWQLDGVKNKGREDFRLEGEGIDMQTHNYWIEQGWNVGIFQWVQLADDGGVPPPREAEAKIYDVNNSLSSFRWKNTKGELQPAVYTKSLMKLYAEEYEKLFGTGYTGGRIHLMGNSLGGNLTMALLMELHQQNITPYPQRVTLIDPYWSLNLTSSQVAFPYGFASAYDLSEEAAILAFGQHNTAIEYYRTSIAGYIGTNDSLIAHTAFTHYGTDYSWNAVTKHTVPVRQYLWSYQFAPPAEISRPNAFTSYTPTGNFAASAATGDARIRELTGNEYYWNHIDGRSTLSPEDDTFEIREGLR